MDVSSQSGSTKRPRAKTATKVAAPKPERKTLTTKKKAVAAPSVVVDMTPEMPVDLTGKIATTAFYLAADRNFAPGHELDDWLEAERRVLGGIP